MAQRSMNILNLQTIYKTTAIIFFTKAYGLFYLPLISRIFFWTLDDRVIFTMVENEPRNSLNKSAAKVVTSNAKSCPLGDRKNCFQQF